MYYLQGFVKLLPYIDNTQNTVAPVGELSNIAETFAKDKGEYTNTSQAPNVELVSFYSKLDADVFEVPLAIQTTILKMGQFLITRAHNGSSSNDAEALRQALLAEFQGNAKAITVGAMIQVGNEFYPSWLAYEDTKYDNKNEIRIWFSDEAFRSQYNHYEIDVVQPIANLDDFFLDPLDVRELLEKYDTVGKIDEINSRVGNYPYTCLSMKEFNYTDPRNAEWKDPTKWIALVWGDAGNNPDAIKTAIQDYVLKHSSHTREEWAKVLPDLFLNTEYILVPLWTKYSIPNKEIQGGIYSPVINPANDIEIVKKAVKGTGYTDSWISTNAEYTHNIYKSLSIGTVAHPENRNKLFRLSEKFPDYIVVPNDSSDFNRMSPATMTFCQHLSQMLKIAETMTDTSTVTRGYPRVIRDGVVFVSVTIENINYLVVTKSSLTKLTQG